MIERVGSARPPRRRARKSLFPSFPDLDRPRLCHSIPLKELETNTELDEAESSRKRRKTTTPLLESDHADLVDEAQYDEDGQEILLSSGRKSGTSLKSPKRTRAKDEGWFDLDAEDEGDPSMVSEYVIEAFQYMHRLEVSS